MILLSPAKNIEIAKAAIQAGADAVYIGAPRFGAREAAGNSLEDIAQLVTYAHQFGVQVHVTLNTLLQEDEYADALQLATQLYEIGIDALLLQDLRLAAETHSRLPNLALHASTQCDNRTPEQVAKLRDMGFRLVVLARELSIDEIRAIHEAVPDIKLEAFVHGALCVSYSGKCFMSEVLMNRSANRGCCAQMCRMRYDLLDKDGQEIIDDNGKPIHQRYLLSLQDLDRSAYLQELIDAGVTTFKIEGRLKDAVYVSNITGYYRQLLDHHTSTLNPAKTFHRGATDYFLHGRTRPMANWDTPKSTGEYIGEVLSANGNTLIVRLEQGITLHNGDGLTVGDEGFYVNGVNGNMVKINKTLTTRLTSSHLYRNYDPEYLRNLPFERRVPVDVIFLIQEEGYRIIYQPLDKNLEPLTQIFVPKYQAATNIERAIQTIEQQLTKLGDTIYTPNSFQLKKERPDAQIPFIPISELNALRRATLEVPKQEVPEVKITLAHPLPKVQEDTTAYPLMTCRYCILFEMGHCRKTNPLKNEPRAIRLQNGTVLNLHFDCLRCEMTINR